MNINITFNKNKGTNETLHQVYHAWNINKNHTHIDYTFAEISNEFTYQGLIIPSKIVREVGYRKHGVWGPVIPFLTNEELKVVLSYNNN